MTSENYLKVRSWLSDTGNTYGIYQVAYPSETYGTTARTDYVLLNLPSFMHQERFNLSNAVVIFVHRILGKPLIDYRPCVAGEIIDNKADIDTDNYYNNAYEVKHLVPNLFDDNFKYPGDTIVDDYHSYRQFKFKDDIGMFYIADLNANIHALNQIMLKDKLYLNPKEVKSLINYFQSKYRQRDNQKQILSDLDTVKVDMKLNFDKLTVDQKAEVRKKLQVINDLVEKSATKKQKVIKLVKDNKNQ
ncbi:MAG: hypothetical protein N4R51_01700 [Lactobacillus crispatus]|nr:hypothetical protein [Lactobacillus crispatus]